MGCVLKAFYVVTTGSHQLSTARSNPTLLPGAEVCTWCTTEILTALSELAVPHSSFLIRLYLYVHQSNTIRAGMMRWTESIHGTKLCAGVKVLRVGLSATECHVVEEISFGSSLGTCSLF